MKAAVLRGLRDIVCEEVPDPQPGPGEVLIKVRYCGICGSDIHGYREGLFPPGTVMGHEFSGDVVEVGSGVENISVGEKATVNPANPCGECRWCRNGRYSLCPAGMAAGIGLSDWSGGLAEYVRAGASQVWKLPANVSHRQGAVIEPLAVALHAVRVSGVSLGQSVLVMGAGAIGLLVMQLARRAGAAKVVVAEVAENRLEAAEKLGADRVFNPLKDELRHVKKEIPEGPDIVFECSGAEQAMNDALRLVIRGGKIMMVGMSIKPVSLSHVHILQKELTLQAALSYSDDFKFAIPLVADGSVDVDTLVTNVVPLADVKEAFDEQVKAENSIKVLIET